jgi:hypothetical protein
VTLGLSGTLRIAIDVAKACYDRRELTGVPFLTQFALYWGPDLWCAMIIVVSIGAHQTWRHGTERALVSSLLTVLFALGLTLLIVAGLLLPFVPIKIQGH